MDLKEEDILGADIGLAGTRRGEREIWRHRQRRVARDRELVGATAAAEAAAGGTAGNEGGGRCGQNERGDATHD